MLGQDTIKSNLYHLKNDLTKITSDPIQIIVVTKTFPAEVYQICYELGISHIGENKVQELINKVSTINSIIKKNISIHFLGHLQTNKIKYLIGNIYSLDSLSSLKQFQKLEALCLKASKEIQNTKENKIVLKPLSVLLQINSTNELNKTGIIIHNEKEIYNIVKKCIQSNFIRLEGLMTIGPTPTSSNNFDVNQKQYIEEARKAFQKTQQIKNNLEKDFSVKLSRLSMGMSQDYKIAVDEGCTEIRIGSLLFGKREMENMFVPPQQP